ncbi:hypothetical protein CesoFtcFv8_001448 [Champsocephalus esox]|uniref:Uncharacterized protein n=2 Tax=Champsocephalus TaxID=52236 RepID=A0AAN8I1Y4_CHAGU|nr:hypothetical protein CesoFtcFv8_001448 [Champsocephalus esox]KAK5935843.1 hypothetical protein CgunFtcFv8_021162 [Champsocephalus gunnari]
MRFLGEEHVPAHGCLLCWCWAGLAAVAVTDVPLGFHLSAANALIDRPRLTRTLRHLSVKSPSSHSPDNLTSPPPTLSLLIPP